MARNHAKVDRLIDVAYERVRAREVGGDPERALDLRPRCPPNMRTVLRMVVELILEVKHVDLEARDADGG